MNTGIGDAFNLAWKLSTVLRCAGPDGLLDTYDRERHSLRTSLQNAQYQSLKYVTHVTPEIMQVAMKAFGETALKMGGEYKMAQAFSQLTIHTRKSPLTLDTLGKRGVRAGDRALNESVALGFETIELYRLIYSEAGPFLHSPAHAKPPIPASSKRCKRWRVPTLPVTS